MAELGYSPRYAQPVPRIEFGGGGGGRGSYEPPAWDVTPQGKSPWQSRPFYEPEFVQMYRSSQMFGRLTKLAALASSVMSAVMPMLDFSQASWPGYHNDIGYQPKGLVDIMETSNSRTAVVVPEDDEQFAQSVWLPHVEVPDSAHDVQPVQPTLISSPSGNRIVSRGDPASVLEVPSQAPQPVWSNADWLAQNAIYEQRLQAAQALQRSWQAENDRFVREQLAKKEGEQYAELMREADAARAAMVELQSKVVTTAPQLQVTFQKVAKNATGVRFMWREGDGRISTDRNGGKYNPKWWRLVNAVLDVAGKQSEVIDALEALAWNVYVLDSRGRVVKGMTKYNRNMWFVFDQVMRGRGRVDFWGFVVDFAVQQWSDAAYAFNARRVDAAALELGWKAPRGLYATLENDFQMQGGSAHGFLSSGNEWIRSQSRLFQSADVWRSQRVQSLWRR